MKALSLLALIMTFSFSNVYADNRVDNDTAKGIAISATVWVPLAVTTYAYAPAASILTVEFYATAATSAVTALGAMDSQLKKQIQALVNKDAQEFYASGNLTAALSNAVNTLKKDAPELSETEAVDLIVTSVNE